MLQAGCCCCNPFNGVGTLKEGWECLMQLTCPLTVHFDQLSVSQRNRTCCKHCFQPHALHLHVYIALLTSISWVFLSITSTFSFKSPLHVSRALHLCFSLFYLSLCIYYKFMYVFIMAALCNRAGHIYFHPVVSSSFFSSPNLSGRRLDIYHTSAHGVALVQI